MTIRSYLKAKTFLGIIMALALSLPVFAYIVDENEVLSQSKQLIEFVNFLGRITKIDTIADIRGIGSHLGQKIRQGTIEADYFGSYTVIHAVDTSDIKLLEADILILSANAKVNHIQNLRHILSGYLQTAYDYNKNDADLLAAFLTVYNAVFRGKTDYFGSRYKPCVMQHLSSQNAGLSRFYYEWPGKTQIVIPLTKNAKTRDLGSLSTKELTEKDVIKEIKKKEDLGIDDRKKIVELTEKEILKDEKKLEDRKKKIQDEDKKIEIIEEKLKQDKKKIEDENKTALDDKKKTELDDKKKLLQEDEKKLKEDKENLDKEKKEYLENKKELKDKEDRVVDLRKDIAEDEKKLKDSNQTITTNQDTKSSTSVLYLETMSEKYSRLVLLDPNAGKKIALSSIETICGRTFLNTNRGILVLVQQTGGTHLVMLDAKTLEPLYTGKDSIAAVSVLVEYKGFFYAIAVQQSASVLACFDADLNLVKSSDVPAAAETTVLFTPAGILLKKSTGVICVLNAVDLKEVKTIR